MVCADVVDHVEVEGVDRYWLSPYRVSALVGRGCAAIGCELMTGAANNYSNVEECFPVDGPSG